MLTLPVNSQPAEKPDLTADGSLEIVSVFDTLQGEGPFAGTPAVFVRLAGCSILCPNCDTDYTSLRKRVTLEALLEQVRQQRLPPALVVVTGGEPFRQDFGPFATRLIHRGYRVQVETNGTLYREAMPYPDPDFHVVCSPKTPTLSPKLVPHVHHLKYVVAAGRIDPRDGLPTSALGLPYPPARPWPRFAGEVFVQPEDDRDEAVNRNNLRAAVESCLLHGYRLTTQLHKGLGLP